MEIPTVENSLLVVVDLQQKLMPVMSDVVFGIIFAGVAGIMVFISVDELLPAAREYGEHHISIYGLIAGMMVMAVSLLQP